MSNKLPESRPLGPAVCGEVRLAGHSAKGNARAVGVLNSTIRASRPDMLPIGVRVDKVAARQLSLYAAQELSDFLQGGRVAEDLAEMDSAPFNPVEPSVTVLVVEDPEVQQGSLESQDNDDTDYDPYWREESIAVAGGVAALRDGSLIADDQKRMQELFDYASTRADEG